MKISAFIRENIEAILQEWEQFADAIKPKTRDMDKGALLDHARLMLKQIADDLDSPQSESEQILKSKGLKAESTTASAARHHGLDRMFFGFDITDVMNEYRFMRATVIRLWSKLWPQEAMDYFDLIRFNEAVDQQIYESVSSFSTEKDLQMRQFDTVLSSMSDHSYILDLEGKFIYANKPLLKDLKVDASALMGKSHFDLNFSTASEIQNAVAQVAQSREQRSGEIRYCFPWGEVRTYEYLFSPVFDGGREVQAVAATERDVTYRKGVIEDLLKSEEKCEATNVELEQRVEQRTQELQEKQSQYLHTEKLSTIGKLSASIAHEFNNPLMGVMGILQGLKKSLEKTAKLEEEDVKSLDVAIEESRRMRNLIRNLQDFNKPSLDRKVLMDVHEAIDALLLLCKSDFRRKGISVITNYAEGLPPIKAIPDQMKQVFLNLLANAADACRKAGGEIMISTCHDESKVAVSVKDNGIGIEPEKIDVIFEPFYTSKPGVEGTGLGLSVCRGIVQTHNGEIHVESQPGKGSNFTVVLPINGG